MNLKAILLSVCIVALLAGPALCIAPVYDFTVVRTDDGSVPGTWVYTLYNNSNQPVSLDSLGVFTNRNDNSASGLLGVDPAPGGWSTSIDDPVDPGSVYPDYAGNYPDDWQVTWVSGLENVPLSGDSVAGFTIQAPAGVSQPTHFEVIYVEFDNFTYQSFTGVIQGVPEPSTAASLATALPCLGIAAWRRRRSRPSH